jgi:hypothetical protein
MLESARVAMRFSIGNRAERALQSLKLHDITSSGFVRGLPEGFIMSMVYLNIFTQEECILKREIVD